MLIGWICLPVRLFKNIRTLKEAQKVEMAAASLNLQNREEIVGYFFWRDVEYRYDFSDFILREFTLGTSFLASDSGLMEILLANAGIVSERLVVRSCKAL